MLYVSVSPVEVLKDVPAVAASHHVKVPDVSEETSRSTEPDPHRLASVVVRSFTIDALITVRGEDTQVPLSNST